MTLAFTSTASVYYEDSGVPLTSYLGQGTTIALGQLVLNSTNGDLYICTNNSNQSALVWNLLVNLGEFPQADWNQTVTTAPSYILNKPVRTQSSATRTLNSGFQISTTHDALVNYSVSISCSMTLTSGQTGTVFLEIAQDSGFTVNLQQLATTVNGNTGTLTVGLNLTQTATATLSGYVPSGYYCRLRTANTTGTPTFSYTCGQEILL